MNSDKFDRQKHWENIYQNKAIDEVSWYQTTPSTSLDLIKQCNLPLNAKIIDVGAGDSFLVDHLLDTGYENITVVDISAKAIERAKERLGDRAGNIKWIQADISGFHLEETYDLWHDRAAFHFLTDDQEIRSYVQSVSTGIKAGGHLILGTFSESGPLKCSGIEIKQYSAHSMTERLKGAFEKINCINVDHQTPFDTVQNFIFCIFKRI